MVDLDLYFQFRVRSKILKRISYFMILKTYFSSSSLSYDAKRHVVPKCSCIIPKKSLN